MRSSTSCGMVMRSSAALALSPLSIVTAVQRRLASLRATAVNTCVPIGLSGLRIVTGASMVASNTSPLDDGKDAGWRLASRDAGRHRRAQDPAVGVVERDLLAPDRHDRHDRLACLTRRDRLEGY